MRPIFALMIALSSSFAFAGPAGLICRGSANGIQITIEAHDQEALNFGSGSGTVSINGRMEAAFEGNEMRINYFGQSVSGYNDEGDSFRAHLLNLTQGYGVLEELEIPQYNMTLRNVPIQCWLR